MITVSDAWKKTYPKAHLGTLAMRDVANPRHHSGLERRKRTLEEQIRGEFGGQTRSDLAALPTMQAYRAYYKRFRKTYHVLLQLRSVALENQPIPSVAALVEVMFMSELKNGLLTAAHDMDVVQQPITLDVAQGDERYILLNGREQTLKPEDMIMTDASGVICSVIYGSDRRTAITYETRRVLFVVYAPEGISAQAVQEHLEDIRNDVLFIASHAVTQELHVYGSDAQYHEI